LQRGTPQSEVFLNFVIAEIHIVSKLKVYSPGEAPVLTFSVFCIHIFDFIFHLTDAFQAGPGYFFTADLSPFQEFTKPVY
jgi:hypothetical protein